MKLVLSAHYALPHLGGVEVVVDRLATGMVRRGHDVCVVASSCGAEDDVPDTDYEVLRVPALNVLERQLDVPYPLFSPRGLYRVMKRALRDASVLHCHGFLFQPTLTAFARRRGAHARVLTEHVGNVKYSSRVLNAVETAAIQTLGRASIRRADVTIALNREIEGLLRRLHPSADVRRIPNGVDLARFCPADADERGRLRRSFGWDQQPRVLFAGRLVAKKGFDTLLETARRAAGAYVLAVAGPRELPPRANGVAQALGRLDPGRMLDAYRAADVLVLLSHSEGFPLSVQEAMASGLPVVVRDCQPFREHLAGAGNGARLVKATAPDVDAAVRATLTAVDARTAAAAFARQRFSLDASLDAHEALYEELHDR